MNHTDQNALREKFCLLNQWDAALASAKIPHDFDQFVLICLKIVNALSYNKKAVNIIAHEFFFIVENVSLGDLSLQLKSDLLAIEQKLDTGLRGFGNLLDAVLGDGSINADHAHLLQRLPKDYRRLARPIESFLDLLRDLPDKEMLPILFLGMVRRLLCLIGRQSEGRAQAQVSEWLIGWGVKERIRARFDAHKTPLRRPSS